MKFLHEYLNNLLSRGKYFFTRQEVISILKLTPERFKAQAYRLSQKKAIRRLYDTFYMIVPVEYYNMGSLPASWVINPLMEYLKQDYYVGLLSAAAMYGATHQQPMSLQVITTRAMKNINLPRGSIDFHIFKWCSSADKINKTVYTGNLFISSREQTMVDLVRFYKVSGHLSNVAMVIKELAEECTIDNLTNVAKAEKTTSVLQRLGYILAFLEFGNLAQVIDEVLKKRKLKYLLLRPEFYNKNGPRDSRWKLIINDSLELE